MSHARARMLSTESFNSYNVWDKPVTGLEIGMVVLGIFLYMSLIYSLTFFYGKYQENGKKKLTKRLEQMIQDKKEKEDKDAEQHARMHKKDL